MDKIIQISTSSYTDREGNTYDSVYGLSKGGDLYVLIHATGKWEYVAESSKE